MGGKKCVATTSTAPGNGARRTNNMPSPAPIPTTTSTRQNLNVPADDEYTEVTYGDDVEEIYNEDDEHRGQRSTKRGRV
jgi:hypothetical protein